MNQLKIRKNVKFIWCLTESSVIKKGKNDKTVLTKRVVENAGNAFLYSEAPMVLVFKTDMFY